MAVNTQRDMGDEQMVADLKAKVFPDREIRFLAVLPEAGAQGGDGRREARVM
ncbi:MAG: hypothetical protein NW217_06600 [Hyphomicrobiaceae bacterium]|nr:hypothetical protein [Hyphomicrobiaceae bacterium]